MILSDYLDLVGKTPVVPLRSSVLPMPRDVDVFAKLEFYNPTGSIKDRPASFIVRKMLLEGAIAPGGTLIESSSGNFGVGLAAVAHAHRIRFICVVDPLLLRCNELLLSRFGAEIVLVDKADDAGGFLKARLDKVRHIVDTVPGVQWVNQYANRHNAAAHFFGTGMEIYETFRDRRLDYVFVAVSSGGTITGISQVVKTHFPQARILAVDVVGSVAFGGTAQPRHIPGIGSSIRPPLLAEAAIDDVLHVAEPDIIDGCHSLLKHFGIFAGGSSGAVFHAALSYFKRDREERVRAPRRVAAPRGRTAALLVFADRGERYTDTIFDPVWSTRIAEREPADPALGIAATGGGR
jgi:cysteine synthase A